MKRNLSFSDGHAEAHVKERRDTGKNDVPYKPKQTQLQLIIALFLQVLNWFTEEEKTETSPTLRRKANTYPLSSHHYKSTLVLIYPRFC